MNTKLNNVASPVWQGYEIQQLIKILVSQQGIELETLLEGSGITSKQLENPALRVSIEQELTLYTRIAKFNLDPYLAVEHGKKIGLNYFSVLGLLMLGADSLKQALDYLVKYFPLISWASHLVLEKDQYRKQSVTSLTMIPTPADTLTEAFEVQSMFVSLHGVLGQILMDDFKFTAVYFKFSSSPLLKEKLQQVFSCPVYFDSDQHRIIIGLEWIKKKLPAAEPEYRQVLISLCQKGLDSLKQERGLIGAIKRFIETYQHSYPTIEQVALHFNQSSRTLRRHLKELGTDYQSIVEQLRFDKAKELLISSALSIEAIANMLHYSDSRSFRTAFKRWQAQTPSQFRDAQLNRK